MARMRDDLDVTLVLIRDAFANTDTGYVRRPPELIGVKQAAVRFHMTERTLRRYCEEKGIALKQGKTWLLVVPALQALLVNDTGGLADAQHDIKTISKLT
jgi:hypothetical protein